MLWFSNFFPQSPLQSSHEDQRSMFLIEAYVRILLKVFNYEDFCRLFPVFLFSCFTTAAGKQLSLHIWTVAANSKKNFKVLQWKNNCLFWGERQLGFEKVQSKRIHLRFDLLSVSSQFRQPRQRRSMTWKDCKPIATDAMQYSSIETRLMRWQRQVSW